VELQSSRWAGGIDALFEYQKGDLALAQQGGQVEQMAQGTGRARQPSDDEDVSGAQVVQGLVELRSSVDLSGRLVKENAVASSCGEGVPLAVGVLVASTHTSVADPAHDLVSHKRWLQKVLLRSFRTRVLRQNSESDRRDASRSASFAKMIDSVQDQRRLGLMTAFLPAPHQPIG
jgi:hypothetical protein